MILSNVAIQAALDEGRIVIVPPPEPRRAEPGGKCPFNTTSVDLRPGHEFVVPEPNRPFAVDLTAGRFSDLVTAENYRRIDCRDGRPYELKPRARSRSRWRTSAPRRSFSVQACMSAS
ncbi:MAG: hypothetical protein ACHQ1G_00725 [Planctomycetota bacterium]